MIRKHFAFTREPFADRIGADELFAFRAHAEAGARIRHLLELRGIGLLTGEVGCGKTTALYVPRIRKGPGGGCGQVGRGFLWKNRPLPPAASAVHS